MCPAEISNVSMVLNVCNNHSITVTMKTVGSIVIPYLNCERSVGIIESKRGHFKEVRVDLWQDNLQYLSRVEIRLKQNSEDVKMLTATKI